MKFKLRRSGAELEFKVSRIAEKVVSIADNYLRHPLRASEFLAVPFTESDVLAIRFREPLKFAFKMSEINIRDGDDERYVVIAKFVFGGVYQLVWTLERGLIRRVEAVCAGGDPCLTLEYPGSIEIAALFVPDVFRKVEESEMSSSEGVAFRWFTEVIDAFKEVRRASIPVSTRDLYDASKVIDDFSLRFLLISLGGALKDVELDFRLNRRVRSLYVEFREFGNPRNPRVEYLKYSLDSRSIDYVNGRRVWRLVAELPEELIDEARIFMRKLFEVYPYVAAAVNYVNI